MDGKLKWLEHRQYGADVLIPCELFGLTLLSELRKLNSVEFEDGYE
jgi:hypothetical protein